MIKVLEKDRFECYRKRKFEAPRLKHPYKSSGIFDVFTINPEVDLQTHLWYAIKSDIGILYDVMKCSINFCF